MLEECDGSARRRPSAAAEGDVLGHAGRAVVLCHIIIRRTVGEDEGATLFC